MNYERPKIVIAVIVSVFTIGVVGCEEPKPLSLEEIQEIKNLVNQSGKITNNQAERLSKVQGFLVLTGLTSITDAQAESLSKVLGGWLSLDGLTSITDQQVESLSKVETLHISEDHQPLIDKYKNQ